MSFLSSAVLRAVPALFILNSGLGKIGMPAEASKGIQQMAMSGIPALEKLPAEKFGTLLGYAETGVAATLLAPFIPNRLAGLTLAGFSSGLLSMYFGNPDNTREDGIRPSDQGTALAKDSWLFAIGVALLTAGNGDKKASKK